jgi:hypothetical protein
MLEKTGYVAVRNLPDEGRNREWLDMTTFSQIISITRVKADSADFACDPLWVDDNRVIRIARVKIVEVPAP